MQANPFGRWAGIVGAVAVMITSCGACAWAADPAGTPPPAIHRAAEGGDLAAIRQLVEADATCIEATNGQGFTPLHVAAVADQKAAIELLLSLGAAIDARDEGRTTPLAVAAANGKTEIVRLLAGKGADIAAQDLSGMTPLHFAAYAGHTATASPRTTASTCRSASSVHMVAWMPPITTATPRFLNSFAIS